MSQATLLKRIEECQVLRDATFGQERTRYGYELLGLQVAAGIQEPLPPAVLATMEQAFKTAYETGVRDGQIKLRVAL